MKKEEIINKLFSLHRFGIKPGLDRTKTLLKFLDNPHQKIPIIHIAGTNGKGSVASFLASILYEAGYKTGLYTSPHIKSFNERIRINGKMIDDENLINISKNLLSKAESINSTFFEITTAIAFEYFYLKKVDIAIIETGMGGRFDSTNVVQPLVSVITNVGMDHMEYLGNSIRKIAMEKAGIIKENVPFVIGKKQDNIIDIFQKKTSNISYAFNDFEIKNIQLLRDLKIICDISNNNLEFNDIIIGIPGLSQLQNIKTVFSVLNHIYDKFIIDNIAIYKGIKNVRKNTDTDNRLELINKNIPVIADIAHNEDAIKNLVNTLKKSEYADIKYNILLTFMKDKEIDKMLKFLKPITNKIIITQVKEQRGANSSLIKSLSNELDINSVIIDDSLTAVNYALNENKPLIILGSFYLIGEIKEIIDTIR